MLIEIFSHDPFLFQIEILAIRIQMYALGGKGLNITNESYPLTSDTLLLITSVQNYHIVITIYYLKAILFIIRMYFINQKSNINLKI